MAIPLTDEQRKLVESVHNLIHFKISRYCKAKGIEVGSDDYHDLISFAEDAVISAAKKFDPSRGVKFATYAGKSVYFSTFNRLRKYLKTQRIRLQKDELMNIEDPHSNTSYNLVCSDLRECLRVLPARYREVVEMRHLHGLQFQEIADRLGVTRQRVDQIEKLALEKMRRFAEENGLAA